MTGIRTRVRERMWTLANSPVGTAIGLCDWWALFRVGGVASPLDLVWAVRLDWPDGTHELVSARRDGAAARRALAADARYWRRGAARPRLSLVRLTLAEYRSHSRGLRWCRSSACPTEAAVQA